MTGQRTIICATGLPPSYLEKQEIFDDFLMHGYIDHHEDKLRFSVDQMNISQKENVFALVRAYFVDGFGDPGLMVFDDQQMKNLEKEFPKVFEWRNAER